MASAAAAGRAEEKEGARAVAALATVTMVVKSGTAAVRAVAAQKVEQSVSKVRMTLLPLRPALFRARHELGGLLDELITILDETTQKVTPHLPKEEVSDDEDYF